MAQVYLFYYEKPALDLCLKFRIFKPGPVSRAGNCSKNCKLGSTGSGWAQESTFWIIPLEPPSIVYTGVRPGGRLFNRTILPNSRLTGQFCFLGVRLTGQLENIKNETYMRLSQSGLLARFGKCLPGLIRRKSGPIRMYNACL